MALTRLVIDGYGQIELNNFAAPRDGRVEAQCKLNKTDFPAGAENGMLVAVDNVKSEVKLYNASKKLPLAVIYSTEHIYSERKNGLKNFINTVDGFYPRLGYLSVGDKFTTNTFCYDTTEFAAETNLMTAIDGIATTPLYAGVSTNGAWKLTATAPTAGPVAIVVKKTTMPDGQLGLKLQILSD